MADPTADEMRTFLAEQFERDEDGALDMAKAIYWFAADHHSGQSSNLYSALSMSEFAPGPCSNGCNECSPSADMYAALIAEFA